MSKLVIEGGRRLNGEIEIEGAKNAVLPVLAATVLNSGLNVIKKCPRLRDVDIMLEILKSIGCKVLVEGSTITIDTSTLNKTEIPDELVAEMRSSIIFMGPMLARCGKVTISYPGGCVGSWAQKVNYKKVKSPSVIFYSLIELISYLNLLQKKV